jgi:mitogen-activated protein kinase 1/3
MFNSHNDGFDEDHVKTILYNLLCAINFIHTADVIHRDLKPNYILIDDQCRIKLCDFGLARCKLYTDDISRMETKKFKDIFPGKH